MPWLEQGGVTCVDLEIASQFKWLMGDPWRAMEEAIWSLQIYRRDWKRADYHEQMTRLPYRLALRADRKARVTEARTRVESTRHCKVCGKSFEFTKFDLWKGRQCRKVTCSRQCGLLASGRHPLIKIGRRMNTLRGWCLEFGMAEKTVRHRVKKLHWDVARALTAPKQPAGRKPRDAAMGAA